jgi:hypothetical protein
VGKTSKRRDRKASVPGKRSRARREGGCTKDEECAHRVQRSAGRLKALDPVAGAKLMVDDAIKGDMSVMRLLIWMVEGKRKPEVKEKPRRVRPVRTWLLKRENVGSN